MYKHRGLEVQRAIAPIKPDGWVQCTVQYRYNAAMQNKLPKFPGPLTARGAVLAVLLSNSDQTGAEPLQGRVTLAAIVKTLKRKYHWPIEAASFPANVPDGRATWATVYSLPPEVIVAALDAGGREWLQSRAR